RGRSTRRARSVAESGTTCFDSSLLCVRHGPCRGGIAKLVRIPGSTGDDMHRRQFLGNTALAALMLPLARGGDALAAPRGRLLPMPLDKGDTVALVSPSAATDDPFDLQLAREAI